MVVYVKSRIRKIHGMWWVLSLWGTSVHTRWDTAIQWEERERRARARWAAAEGQRW